ncbi:unnamed protein product [Cylicostephanus goldi]|uniref:Uncharacterized protein n=1 Tax=Cylicostephanus goldi TaxID=71465 RepID=A0A3P6S223_CYLGO|nr:unnamed protein product [Cylicostephanus goldi]
MKLKKLTTSISEISNCTPRFIVGCGVGGQTNVVCATSVVSAISDTYGVDELSLITVAELAASEVAATVVAFDDDDDDERPDAAAAANDCTLDELLLLLLLFEPVKHM